MLNLLFNLQLHSTHIRFAFALKTDILISTDKCRISFSTANFMNPVYYLAFE